MTTSDGTACKAGKELLAEPKTPVTETLEMPQRCLRGIPRGDFENRQARGALLANTEQARLAYAR